MRSTVAAWLVVGYALSGGCSGVVGEAPIPMVPPPPGNAYAFACGDTVLNDQLTTGGARVTSWMPCWNVEEERRQHAIDLELAAEDHAHEAAATADRVAQALVDREAAACARVPLAEREHSPFAHRREISDVKPQVVDGVVHGVVVRFAPVRGLTAAWMEQDIACHQAHVAVVGHVPAGLADDPTLMPDAEVHVVAKRGVVTVTVTERSPAEGERALALMQKHAPQTATR
nr:hypothetical protein [Kofleriaceae bacterium]